MKRTLLISLGLFVISASAADYQQLPGHFSALGSDGSTIAVADDFQLGQDTLIGSLTGWGGYFNPPTGPDSFTIRFFG